MLNINSVLMWHVSLLRLTVSTKRDMNIAKRTYV